MEKKLRMGLMVGIPLTILTIVLRILLSTKPVTDTVNVVFGMRKYNGICLGVNIAIGIFVLCVTICGSCCLAKFLLQERTANREEEERQRQERLLARYASSKCSPEMTREVLKNVILKKSKDMQPLVDNCLGQLAAIDDIRYRQSLLRSSNGAEYIQKTVVAVNNAEIGICNNIRGIINSCTTAKSYATINQNEVDKYLKRNKELIDCAERALQASSTWVNSVNDGERKGSERELEGLISVIKDILEEGQE